MLPEAPGEPDHRCKEPAEQVPRCLNISTSLPWSSFPRLLVGNPSAYGGRLVFRALQKPRPGRAESQLWNGPGGRQGEYLDFPLTGGGTEPGRERDDLLIQVISGFACGRLSFHRCRALSILARLRKIKKSILDCSRLSFQGTQSFLQDLPLGNSTGDGEELSGL